ncbi:MAG: GNAT family N-acetyltransferase [Candidatus Eisenbacteria bacterium]
MNPAITIRPRRPQDEDWLSRLLAESWGSTRVVTRGRLHDANRLPALVAECDGHPAGALTYRIEGEECELVTLNSLLERRGVGSALLKSLIGLAREAGCRRVWLITTNDNTPALRFYQLRGMGLVAVHRGAVDRSRRLKPEIPAVGLDGIALRDEIELEILL